MADAFSLIFTNIASVLHEIERWDERKGKAAVAAAKVEGFRLKGLLAAELRAGSPGGAPLPDLSVIAKGRGRRKPLAKLARVVRYRATGATVRVGFLPGMLSASWLRIAQQQQEGFSAPAEKYRTYFHRLGRKYKGATAQYFHLRRSTTTLQTPARPIIGPFWAAHEAATVANIRRNWERKMAGERI